MPVIAASKCVHSVEGQVVELDEHYEMANSGWSNPTPGIPTAKNRIRHYWPAWRHYQPGEESIPAVFSLHDPPFGSCLDEAPELTKDLRPPTPSFHGPGWQPRSHDRD